MMKQLIVSRHPAAQKKLRELFPSAELVEQATPDIVAGAHVIGNLPHSLSSKCAKFTEVTLSVPREFRGTEFTEDDLVRFGFALTDYVVLPAAKYENLVAEVDRLAYENWRVVYG